MNMYILFIIVLAVAAFAFFADTMVRKNRKQESIKASWSDIWTERLKNGR